MLKRFQLTTALSAHLAEKMLGQEWAPGETIIREGEAGESMFFIVRGRLRVFRMDADGKPLQVGEMGKGDFFGEISLLRGGNRSASVIAERHSFLYELTCTNIRSFLRDNARLADELRDALARREENDRRWLG